MSATHGRYRHWIFIIVLATTFASCRKKQDVMVTEVPPQVETPVVTETPSDSLFCRYERTPCFGRCPVFELKIYRSGYAVYEGRNFVDLIGFYHTTFSATSLQKISGTAEAIKYFSLKDSYDNPYVTDLPTITTEIHTETHDKSVTARYQSPAELQTLYAALDSLIASAEWKLLKKNQ
jgi:Domain of unknown function (DUF6438)